MICLIDAIVDLINNININEDRQDLLDHFPLLESDSPVAGARIQNVVWCHVPLKHDVDHGDGDVVDDDDHLQYPFEHLLDTSQQQQQQQQQHGQHQHQDHT